MYQYLWASQEMHVSVCVHSILHSRLFTKITFVYVCIEVKHPSLFFKLCTSSPGSACALVIEPRTLSRSLYVGFEWGVQI